NSLNDLKQAIDNGCSVQKVKYTLRYPEVMICDLSNPEFPLNLCDSQTIYDCFILIENLLDGYLKNTNVFRVYGDELKTEIAITGPKKQEIQYIKEAVLWEVYEKVNIKNKMYLNLYEARGIHQIRNFNDSSEDVKSFYNSFTEKYKEYIKPEAYGRIEILNQDLIYQNNMVWVEIQKLAENKLFILTAGIPIALGYMNYTMDNNIHFTEVHRQNDPYQMYRRKTFNSIYPELNKEDKNKSTVIIDKIYTGGTLQVAESILNNHESAKKTLKVGLFPKSYHSLENVDYVIYAGKLIKSEYILRNFSPEDWHFDLLFKTSGMSTLNWTIF